MCSASQASDIRCLRGPLVFEARVRLAGFPGTRGNAHKTEVIACLSPCTDKLHPQRRGALALKHMMDFVLGVEPYESTIAVLLSLGGSSGSGPKG